MNQTSKLAGWRATFVMWSPGVTLFALSLALGIDLLSAALFGFLGPLLAWFAYVIVLAGLNRILGSADADLEKEAANAMESAMKPAGAAGLVVAALVWGWWHFDARKTERFVASCVEEYAYRVGPSNRFVYEFEFSVNSTVAWCFEQEGESSDPDE